MTKILAITAMLLASMGTAYAADAQRAVGGGLFPIFVNETDDTQAMTPQVFVNQTQADPPPSGDSTSRGMLLGVGR